MKRLWIIITLLLSTILVWCNKEITVIHCDNTKDIEARITAIELMYYKNAKEQPPKIQDFVISENDIKVLRDNWLSPICYVDVVWQKWDAMTSCWSQWSSGNYVWKICDKNGCIRVNKHRR